MGFRKGQAVVMELHGAGAVTEEEETIAFVRKDSGERMVFGSGMQRDVTDDKIDYTLALDGPMFKRLAIRLTKGAKKYEKRNWMKASGEAELERFRESALRHFIAWFEGVDDEDHAAAILFNVNGAEYVSEKLAFDRNARLAESGWLS